MKKAEYSLTAETLLSFGRNPPRGERSFAQWAAFADKVGQAIFPFIIKPDCFDNVPFRALGMTPVKLSDMVPQPGEMWVLFCFKDSFREAVSPDSPLRTDGFPLVLEWRRGQPDSDLLSSAFHDLAGRVREQFGEDGKGWGLYPAFARYGDAISFTDFDLFSDAENSLQIASSWGALAVGLHCCTTKKYYGAWPFPSVQWNWIHNRAAGVAGIAEKLSVAADCGARVVTVAQEQRDSVLELLAKLKMSDDGNRYGKLSVIGSRNVSDPKELARRLCHDAGRRVLALRMAILAAVCFFALVIMAFGYWFDWRREKIAYYADYVERNGVAEGRFPVNDATTASRGRTYRFHYQGYDSLCPWSRNRILRAMWCVNGKGALRVDENDYPEHPPVTGFRYYYDERGRVSGLERCAACGRVLNTIRYSGDNVEVADVFGADGYRSMAGVMRFSSSKGGEPVRRVEYVRDGEGYVVEKVFRRDSSGMAASENGGVSRVSFELLKDGRIACMRYLDWRGVPVVNANGVHLERFTYEEDRLVRIQYSGLDEMPMDNVDHEDERTYQYSQAGNLVKVEKLKNGRLRQRVSYDRDASGDVVRESLFFAEGVRPSTTWMARDILMDDGGNVTRETFLDFEGSKLRRKDNRVATMTRCFSNRGELTEMAYYDENDRLMIGANGYAAIRFKRERSPDGYVVWRQYFGEDNMPMLVAKEGIASERKTFDAFGREIEWEMFGVKEEKVNGALGWQRAVLEYGRDGRRVGERFFDKSGMPMRTGKEH